MSIIRTNFLGYPVDDLNYDDILHFVSNSIKMDLSHYIAVQNANKMYLSDRFPQVKEALNKASVILPENAINIGMRLLRKPLKQKNMGGLHIMEFLLQIANENNYSIYLLGTKQENLLKLVTVLTQKYPNIIIKGYRNGYFTEDDESIIVEGINKLKPNFLFVGMGSPRQEIFIVRYLDVLNVNISLGVGGSFNVIGGIEKPAPQWTKHGLEWLYRSFHDPQKFKRYLIINSYFLYRFFQYMFSGK